MFVLSLFLFLAVTLFGFGLFRFYIWIDLYIFGCHAYGNGGGQHWRGSNQAGKATKLIRIVHIICMKNTKIRKLYLCSNVCVKHEKHDKKEQHTINFGNTQFPWPSQWNISDSRSQVIAFEIQFERQFKVAKR